MDRITVEDHADPAGRADEGGCVYNGMPARDLGTEGWHKPWSGGNGGNCVEAMKLADGRVAVRQSADPDGPALIYTTSEIHAFIQGAKSGQADFLLS
ncbi:DUF397 domain-containing protein [Streptomyces sp. LHD-70]|uniref:DUF397 domain-containing protein n=1 Tax=Streptomyces sp. LHD-70 TaxID=3072140 RepID=UPI0035BE7951